MKCFQPEHKSAQKRILEYKTKKYRDTIDDARTTLISNGSNSTKVTPLAIIPVGV